MKCTTPLISVVTVCYQSEEFLEQCIQSVVSQTFENFEYVIIDGGSSDGSVDVIKKYQTHLAYWHSRSDRGLSHAFNLGLEQCKGRWITFLNSDDIYIDSSVLTEAARELQLAENVDVLHGRIQHIRREKVPVTISSKIGGPWQWRDFRRYSTIPHPASFVCRDLFEEVGDFDENYRNALDYEFFLRKGKKLRVSYIPNLIVQMRIGGISTLEAERSLRESRDAQIKNGVNSLPVAYFWWAYFRLRILVKKWLLG